MSGLLDRETNKDKNMQDDESFEVKIYRDQRFQKDYNRLPVVPEKKSKGAACMDLCVFFGNKNYINIRPGETVALPTGLYFQFPETHKLVIVPRSGISLKGELLLVNAPGTIDSDYRGEVKIIMKNISSGPVTVNNYDRMAQCYFEEVVHNFSLREVVSKAELDPTARGEAGFGSTGVSSSLDSQTQPKRFPLPSSDMNYVS